MATVSPIIQKFLEKNGAFKSSFHPMPTLEQYAALLAAEPDTPRICIVTCCDPRVVPEQIFGLSPGEAIVMRVPGGSLEPALAGILAIDAMAPLTSVIVMRHTDCGTARWTDEGVRQVLAARSGESDPVGRRSEKVVEMWFGESTGIDGDEELLRNDVEWLKASPIVREEMKSRVVGMIYVTETGEAKVVC